MIKAKVIDSEFKDKFIELECHRNYIETVRCSDELKVASDVEKYHTFREYYFSHVKDGISIYTELKGE